jgi:DNA repair ATPase RecN
MGMHHPLKDEMVTVGTWLEGLLDLHNDQHDQQMGEHRDTKSLLDRLVTALEKVIPVAGDITAIRQDLADVHAKLDAIAQTGGRAATEELEQLAQRIEQ